MAMKEAMLETFKDVRWKMQIKKTNLTMQSENED